MISSPLHAKSALSEVKIALAEVRLMRCLRKYSPTQPRVPAGGPDGGQWTSGGGYSQGDDLAFRVAAFGGDLYAELPYPGGRYCVYSYGGHLRMIEGPTNFPCPKWTTEGGTSHGRNLNDNFPKK
jgi:hypothetical protein